MIRIVPVSLLAFLVGIPFSYGRISMGGADLRNNVSDDPDTPGHCVEPEGVKRRDAMAGVTLAMNELSLLCDLPSDVYSLRFSLNMDMTGIIKGDYTLPGISSDVLCLFTLYSRNVDGGEVLKIFAGPGIALGLVRDTGPEFGVMAGLAGSFGIDYSFAVPFSISLSLDPVIGLYAYPGEYDMMKTGIYRNGVFNSIVPHLSIRYRF